MMDGLKTKKVGRILLNMAESEQHKELKQRAVWYLWDKGCWVARAEVDCGYYGRYDAWGIKSNRETIGIEVKVSRADFRNNRQKEIRLHLAVNENNRGDINSWIPANLNYIMCPKGMLQVEEIDENYGLLWYDLEKKRIQNKKQPKFIPMSDTQKLRIIMYLLSSKMNNIKI